MDQKPNKATFVSRDVQSSAQLHIGQTEPQEKQQAPLFLTERLYVSDIHAHTGHHFMRREQKDRIENRRQKEHLLIKAVQSAV